MSSIQPPDKPPLTKDAASAHGPVRPVIDYRALGSSALKQFGGYIYDNALKDLDGHRGIETYRLMGETDATCGAILYTINRLIRQLPWRVAYASTQPFDVQAGDFLESCMHDMEMSWHEFISEQFTFLQYGFSVAELVYKRRAGDSPEDNLNSTFADGRIGWRGIFGRPQQSIQNWVFDDNGKLLGAVQNAPPRYQQVYLPLEKCVLFRTTSEHGNPQGVSILRNAYKCFSADTELLTARGWVLAGDIVKDDAVATRCPDGSVAYQEPTHLWSYPYTGQMIRAQSRFVDQLVTPNHRMFVRREHRTDYEFIEASDCGASVSFSALGQWTGTSPKSMLIGEKEVLFDVWCQFMGHFLAEGHTSGGYGFGYTTGITQKDGPKSEAIAQLLARTPFKWTKRAPRGDIYTYFCHDKALYEHLRPLGKQLVRYIPRYLLDAKPEHLTLFLDAFHAGDGTINRAPGYPGTKVIYTASEVLADGLMEAGLKCGYRTSKRWHAMAKNNFTGRPGGIWYLALGKHFPKMTARWSEEGYSGEVYCVTTANGVVMTRRNGKPSWSGNSFYTKRGLEGIEAVGCERDVCGIPVVWLPKGLLRDAAAGNKEAILAKQEYFNLVTNIRRDEQEGICMPLSYDENGNKEYDLTLLSSGGSRQFDLDKIIRRHATDMARAVMSDFLFLGDAGGTGSYAMHSDKTDMYLRALRTYVDSFTEAFNQQAVRRLMKLNNFHMSDYPRIEAGSLDKVDATQLADTLVKLSQAGMTLFPDPELEASVRQSCGLPEQTPEDDSLVRPQARTAQPTPTELVDSPAKLPAEEQAYRDKMDPAGVGFEAGGR